MFRSILAVATASGLFLCASQLYAPRATHAVCDGSRFNLPHKKSTVDYAIMISGATIVSYAAMCLLFHLKKTAQAARYMLFCGFIASMLLISGVSEHMKRAVSSLRPDFCARCVPDAAGQCSGNPADIIEGRKSFPSGHTASIFGIILFNLYTLHVVRVSRWKITVMAAAMLCFGAFVGWSRMHDNKHFLKDVLGGVTISVVCSMAIFSLMNMNIKDWTQQDLGDGMVNLL